MKIQDIEELKLKAKNIRKSIIEEVYSASSGHPGGSLSCADILTVLYFNQMNFSKENLNDKNRDRFVLSKGHCSPALYATLAEMGIIDKEELHTFRKLGSNLQGHPDRNKVQGVEMTTGSLGQGLSVSNGMAIVAKMDGLDYRVYCLVGDGEIQEGQVWEAAMTSNKYKLDNLCLIVDNNNLQIDGTIEEVKGLNDIGDKFRSFGFEIFEANGNNIEELINVFNKAKEVKGKPTAIIAKTTKGKGVSYMENKAEWHGKSPNQEQYEIAMKELSL